MVCHIFVMCFADQIISHIVSVIINKTYFNKGIIKNNLFTYRNLNLFQLKQL